MMTTRDSGVPTIFLTSLRFASSLDMMTSLRLLIMITTTAAVITSSSVMLYVIDQWVITIAFVIVDNPIVEY